MIKKLLRVTGLQTEEERQNELRQKLLRHEAKIGGQLFGPVKKGTRRQFFCLDEYTWVWHEEWTDKQGTRQVQTTRYNVRPDTILKSQNGGHYQEITDTEASRLFAAAQTYEKRVTRELYQAVA